MPVRSSEFENVDLQFVGEADYYYIWTPGTPLPKRWGAESDARSNSYVTTEAYDDLLAAYKELEQEVERSVYPGLCTDLRICLENRNARISELEQRLIDKQVVSDAWMESCKALEAELAQLRAAGGEKEA